MLFPLQLVQMGDGTTAADIIAWWHLPCVQPDIGWRGRFGNDEEADRLEALFAATKARDDFQMLAWCALSTHYLLAVRVGEVPLSRSIRTIHHRFAQVFNRQHGVFDPLWRCRRAE